MSNLSKKELYLLSNKILEDYDAKNPSTIFKDKINITNDDALIIQSNVAKLREKRGEEEKQANDNKMVTKSANLKTFTSSIFFPTQINKILLHRVADA